MTKIGFGAKFSYGIGTMTYSIKDAAFAIFVLLFYKQVLGLSGSLTGLAIFISVMWDAVSDPMIGAWSDRLKSRWGRRHPMMVAGTLPLAFSFVMLFYPLESVRGTQWPLFLWLLASVIAVRTFLTVFIIPHTAMGAEISDDYHERTSIVNFRTNLGWTIGVLLPAITLPLLFRDSGGVDGRFVIENYYYYGWVSFFAVIIAAVICIMGTRQFIPRLKEVASRNKPSVGFSGMIRDTLATLGNENFKRIILLDLAMGAMMGIMGALNMIAYTYFWELTIIQISVLSLASIAAVAIFFPGMRFLAQRWQKQDLLKFSVIGLFFNTLWLYPARLLDLLPENGSALLFVFIFVNMMLFTSLTIIRTVNIHSIMADIADEHELKTGRRQEGVFFAAAAFATKFVMGFGYMVAGPLLDIIGLEAGVAPGDAPDTALLGIGLVMGPLLALLYVVPWWMSTKLDVSKERLAEVHSQLRSGNKPA
ncbi:MAG: MFS transporter [Oceanicoccus sp.]